MDRCLKSVWGTLINSLPSCACPPEMIVGTKPNRNPYNCIKGRSSIEDLKLFWWPPFLSYPLSKLLRALKICTSEHKSPILPDVDLKLLSRDSYKPEQNLHLQSINFQNSTVDMLVIIQGCNVGHITLVLFFFFPSSTSKSLQTLKCPEAFKSSWKLQRKEWLVI